MTPIKEYLNKVKSYCDLYLEFDETNGRYKFNKEYADEINCEQFENEIVKLKTSFVEIIETIKKPKVFIQDILDILVKFPYWYDKEEIYKLSSFYKLNKRIVVSKESAETKPKYSLASIFNYPEDLRNPNDLSKHLDLDDIEYYLISNKSLTNNYKDKIDFEKVKLTYVLSKFYYSIKEFMAYLFQIDDVITKYGFSNFNRLRLVKNPTQRCVFNLSKIELATFFEMLFVNGLCDFELDGNEKKEKAKFEFINKNLSYINREKQIIEVNNINKEFRYLGYNKYKERQTEIINSLIKTLEKMRGSL